MCPAVSGISGLVGGLVLAAREPFSNPQIPKQRTRQVQVGMMTFFAFCSVQGGYMMEQHFSIDCGEASTRSRVRSILYLLVYEATVLGAFVPWLRVILVLLLLVLVLRVARGCCGLDRGGV